MRMLHLVAALAVIVAVGAAGLAIGASSADPLQACAAKSGRAKGVMRLVPSGSRCRKGERKVTWNRQGVAGLPGAAGPTGPRGVDAPQNVGEVWNQGLFSGGTGLVMQPGNYRATANLQLANTGETALDVTCRLDIGPPSGAPGAKDVKTVTVPSGARAAVTLDQIHILSAAGPVNATCDAGSWSGLLIVQRVGPVHEI